MPSKGMEIVQCSLLKEYSASMQFVEMREVSLTIAAGKFPLVAAFSGWKILQNGLNDELMWCLVVFQHDCMASTFSFLLKDILCLK